MPTTIMSKDKDGNDVAITLSKEEGERDRGKIQVVKRKAGTGELISDNTNQLKDIKVNKACTKVQAKAETATITADVTITISCPEPPKTPTITVDIQTGLPFNAGGGETVYNISEADQQAIQGFLKESNFPPLAFVGDIGGSALAALLDRPTLVGRPALSRFALTVLDVGNTLREDANDWIDFGASLRYIGFDPGVDADLRLDTCDEELSLVLTVRMPTRTLTDLQLRFRDAFIHPMRAERARDVDPRIVDDPSRRLVLQRDFPTERCSTPLQP